MYKSIKNTKTTLLTALVLGGLLVMPGMAAAEDSITVTDAGNTPVVADTNQNIAAGQGATATAKDTNGKSAYGNTAVGGGAKALSEYGKSTAVGAESSASNYGDVAVGSLAGASGGYATAIGYGASATSGWDGGTNLASTAIGNGANATNGGTAIGQNSIASEKDTVSVGNTTTQRRIVNVAKGTSASDAATVAQTSSIDMNNQDSNLSITSSTATDGHTVYKIGLSKDLTLDSTTTGALSVTGDATVGGTLYANTLSGNNLAVAGDASVGGTLYASDLNLGGQSMLGRLNDLSQSVRDTGAHAAALAALHPQDYDPEDKFSVAAGYGHYSGSHAAALGLYYQPSEDISIGVGRTFGSGYEGDMWNLGVSFKFGRGKSTNTASRTSLTRSVQELTAQNVAMADELTQMKEQIASLLQTIDELKAK